MFEFVYLDVGWRKTIGCEAEKIVFYDGPSADSPVLKEFCDMTSHDFTSQRECNKVDSNFS